MMDRWISSVGMRSVCVALLGALLIGCKKDEEPTLSLDPGAIMVQAAGESGTLRFVATNTSRISVINIPDGWDIVADLATMTITATAPADLEAEDADISGTATVIAYGGESSATAKLFVGITRHADLDDQLANCVVVSQPETYYSFDAMNAGEAGKALDTYDVRVIWQTDEELIRYGIFEAGRYSFYIGSEEDGSITDGNALVGAYGASGELLWTWHVWAVDADDVKEQTYANGKTFMSLNLGALGNTNASTDEVLNSFGMFYQWGRRTPFVGPLTYDAAKGEDAAMYNGYGAAVELEYVVSSPEIGTVDYAEAHPLSYILGAEESAYDWAYTSHAEQLWGEKKTVHDPCPKGWRVPTSQELAALDIVDRAAGTEADYGWMLTDGSVTSFYPAAGFRTYLTGGIQNLYNPVSGVEVPKPWMGYYWTSAMAETKSEAMIFWFDATDAAKSDIVTSSPYYRANGMQIRCVKE